MGEPRKFQIYEAENDLRRADGRDEPPVGIGEDSVIENAIIDKNARVGSGVQLQNVENHVSFEDGTVIIRDGLTVVPRGGVVPDGYRI